MSYIGRLVLVAGLTLAVFSGGALGQKKAKPANVNVAEERAALLGDDADRAAAAAANLAIKKPGALDALIDGLAMGLHPTVAVAALDALAAHGDARAFDVAAHYAHHRNARIRAAAVRALGTLDDARAQQAVLAALHDGHVDVRAAAAQVVADKKLKKGIEPLMALLTKGDEAAASALAALADPALAAAIGELIGTAPDALLARCLGMILLRPDFKPESARVEVVRALGKVPGNEALEQLTNYVASTPENPPRQSRREAEALVEARLGGD